MVVEQALRDQQVVRLIAAREEPRRSQREGRQPEEDCAGREYDEEAPERRPGAHAHDHAAPSARAEHRPGDLADDDQPHQRAPGTREDPQDRHDVGQPRKIRHDQDRQRIERHERVAASRTPRLPARHSGNGPRRAGQAHADDRADDHREHDAGRELGQVRQHGHPYGRFAARGDVERAHRYPERRARGDPRAHSPEVHSISSMMVYNSTLPAGPGCRRAGRRWRHILSTTSSGRSCPRAPPSSSGRSARTMRR